MPRLNGLYYIHGPGGNVTCPDAPNEPIECRSGDENKTLVFIEQHQSHEYTIKFEDSGLYIGRSEDAMKAGDRPIAVSASDQLWRILPRTEHDAYTIHLGDFAWTSSEDGEERIECQKTRIIPHMFRGQLWAFTPVWDA
ncbi:hypothetical protein RhiJN_25139 [Ceratobasidium sp. AG-Ba]|nr:hypothetical protein RhiJN_25139 [Ceratobasidium sp. AG-Ba]